jgi:hypothetical protein
LAQKQGFDTLKKPHSSVKKNTIEKRYQLFCVLKVPVLRCKRACFTVQKSLFYHVKQPLLQGFESEMVTRYFLFGDFFTLV